MVILEAALANRATLLLFHITSFSHGTIRVLLAIRIGPVIARVLPLPSGARRQSRRQQYTEHTGNAAARVL